jgi:3-methyladenine DNA glycosylase AlkD
MLNVVCMASGKWQVANSNSIINIEAIIISSLRANHTLLMVIFFHSKHTRKLSPHQYYSLTKSIVFLLALWTCTSTAGVAAAAMAPSSSSSSKTIVKGVVSLAQKELRKVRDPSKAEYMQKYLKTDMPMYGLQRSARAAVEKEIYNYVEDKGIVEAKKKRIPNEIYQGCIQTLWALPNREEKYLAIDFALKYKHNIEVVENMDVYESMLREDYMWWDLVDPIAVNLVGQVTRSDFESMENLLRRWIRDDNMWIRRTAILAQLKSKTNTREDMLFEFCRLRMHETEFFIRKAIGWVLREYSKTSPEAVIAFLEEEKAHLSGLSYREGSKNLVKKGLV